MSQVQLTKHVIDKCRQRGIALGALKKYFQKFCELHLSSKENDKYNIRRGGTCFIIKKENQKYILITIYGAVGWMKTSKIWQEENYQGFRIFATKKG